MNVYDFDGTLFYPNATFKFALWCIFRHPVLLFSYVPYMLTQALLYKLGKLPYHKFIRVFFGYMPKLKDLEGEIEKFWDWNEKYIAKWYLAQKRSDDLIISGSPECLIKPIADRLGVKLMATLYDPELGVLYGNLMLAKSKSRFIIDMGMPVIENFYSDSLSDTPIALCAEHAFLVTKMATKPVPWPELTPEKMKEIKKELNTGWKYIEE